MHANAPRIHTHHSRTQSDYSLYPQHSSTHCRTHHQKHVISLIWVAHCSCSEEQLAAAAAARAAAAGAGDSLEEQGIAALRGEQLTSAGCSSCAVCTFFDVPTKPAQRAFAAVLSCAAFALCSAFAMPAAARPPCSSQWPARRPAPSRRPPWPPFLM